MNGLSTAISGVGSAVGRYFSIVSFIPSLFLTGFTFALIESGAWNGNKNPDWAKAGDAFAHPGNLALLILISIALGVAVHPIQFSLMQFFEGYWGTGKLAQRARVVRILHHRKRYISLHLELGLEADTKLKEADNMAEQAANEARKARSAKKTAKAEKAEKAEESAHFKPEVRVTYRSIADESKRLANGYPVENAVGNQSEYDNIMPTRLGNVLRRYERLAGSQYKLDAVRVIRHVALVASTQRVEYLNDQRQLLDLSVRMSATSIFGTLIAIAFLWQHGPWLLIALIPYCIAYLSYRGAVTVAHEYGAAISTIIDLDRFALYDHLRIPRPKSAKAERQVNEQLVKLLAHNLSVDLTYEHPGTSEATDTDSMGT